MQIEVKHPTVQEVFKESFYEIPAFQREYVWKEQQVNSLLTDVMDALFDEKGSPSSGEYFIGSIVAYLDDQGVFQLIDGQQRITTLFIVLCAIRDNRKALNDPEPIHFLQGMIQDQYQKLDGTTGTRLRLKPLYEDAGTVLQDIAMGHETPHQLRKALPQSARNMLATYEFAVDFLNEHFGHDVASLRMFQAHLCQRVRLVRIQTLGISDALRIFETINDRGVGLNALDLLKNLLFMQVERTDFDRLTSIWKDMVHTIEKTGKGEKPLRFLRYFVLANFADARKRNKPLTEDDLYEWLSANKDKLGITQDPIAFAQRLFQAALLYKKFVSEPDFALSNVYALSGRARQHLIVLLACQSLNDEALAVVTRQLERLFVTYVLAQEPTKVLDSVFADIAPKLGEWIAAHKVQTGFIAELGEWMQSWVNKEIQRLTPRVSAALDRMGLERKLTCRFVLWRLSQYLESLACTPLGDASISHFTKFEVEHVLPNNPSADLKAGFDKPNEYDRYKALIGNLTLLEKPINASLGRDYFAVKQVAYGNSGLFMTKSLSKSQAVGVNTSYVKASQWLCQHTDWSSAAIEARQQDLKRLVMKMLAMESAGDTP